VPVWSAPAEGVSDPAKAGRFGRTADTSGAAESTPKAVSPSETRLPPQSTPRPTAFACRKLAPFVPVKNGANLSGGVVPIWSAVASAARHRFPGWCTIAPQAPFIVPSLLRGMPVARIWEQCPDLSEPRSQPCQSGVALEDSLATALHTVAEPVPCLVIAPFSASFLFGSAAEFIWLAGPNRVGMRPPRPAPDRRASTTSHPIS